MFKDAAVLFLYAQSPVHFGSGTSLGAVDLPIQRERHTQFPIGQASGIKGAMRDFVEQKTDLTPMKAALRAKERDRDAAESALKAALEDDITQLKDKLTKLSDPVSTVFGPERDASAHGGALAFKDARVLLFPVRSLKGVYAYVTCPTLIEGFKRDLQHVPGAQGPAAQAFTNFSVTFAETESDRCAVSSSGLTVGDKVVLEDFAFTVKSDLEAQARQFAHALANAIFPPPQPARPGQAPPSDPYRYWREKLRNTVVILPDDAFRDFAQFSTEVQTRIKISDDTGTVEQGALFTEEHLPSETVLYTLALATDAKKLTNGAPAMTASKILETFHDWLAGTPVIQCGGDETVGRGLIYVNYWRGGMGVAGQASTDDPAAEQESTTPQGGEA